MTVQKIAIHPTHKKDNGQWTLSIMNILPNTFNPHEQALILLPAKQAAGNHKHAREEAILGIGQNLFFVWQDSAGSIREEPMNPNGDLYLFIIPPQVPHGVVNRSDGHAVLYEYFNDAYSGVEKVTIAKV